MQNFSIGTFFENIYAQIILKQKMLIEVASLHKKLV